jgi:hypothetical protein
LCAPDPALFVLEMVESREVGNGRAGGESGGNVGATQDAQELWKEGAFVLWDEFQAGGVTLSCLGPSRFFGAR